MHTSTLRLVTTGPVFLQKKSSRKREEHKHIFDTGLSWGVGQDLAPQKGRSTTWEVKNSILVHGHCYCYIFIEQQG